MTKSLVIILILIVLGGLIYFSRDSIKRTIRPDYPDSTAIALALESAYEKIEPLSVKTSSVDMDGRKVRVDHVELSRHSSLLRANLEITRAVVQAGGDVDYGIESQIVSKRREYVTIGITAGDHLMCEVKLERRARR